MYTKEQNIDITAQSAGIAVFGKTPPSENAILAAREYGADISSHLSRQIDESIIEKSDAILCMTLSHQKALEQMCPKYADKIMCLGDTDIPDPYGQSLAVYRKTAEAIRNAIEKLPLESGGKND